MKLSNSLAGILLLGAVSLGGCKINDHVYFGSPRWDVSSWTINDRYEVSKNGRTCVLRDKKTGEKWKRVVGEFKEVDKYGRRIHNVQRMYFVNDRECREVVKFPKGVNRMMNGDQGIADKFEKKYIGTLDGV